MKPYLFSHLDEIAGRLSGRQVSVFLDFDGTLAPIVNRPEDAVLPTSMKEILQQLAGVAPLAIVSGRGSGNAREKVGIPGLVYAGNHGLEIEGEGLSYTIPEAVAAQDKIACVMAELRGVVDDLGMPGAVFEDKGLTASIHYRLLEGDVEAFLKALRNHLRPYAENGALRIVEGKKVVEIRPGVAWDKGKAVEWLLAQERFKGSIPVYAGDDLTDCDAFRAIDGTGISVAVGLHLDDADYYLRTQEEVEEFLRWLTSAIEAKRS
ncbi:MAG: trehalose-phosphatase [Nitrospirota bacterium]|nr:trehalose-phosphatase [Nitrospirota bacterium]